MKKHLFTIASVAMVAGAVTFTSCKKEDTTAPTITISAGSSMNQSLPSTAGAGTFTAPSATASDDQDGDLSTSITVDASAVNPNTKGAYSVIYTVSDAAGNSTSETLTVNIVNDAEALVGNYSVHDTVPTLAAFLYNQTIATDNYVNNKIHFTHTDGFAFYANNLNIYANVSGTTVGATVTLPTQTANNIGSPAENHSFLGNGSVLSVSPYKFDITYTDNNLSNSTTANNCVQTYTHQ